MAQTNIQIRVDSTLKKQAEKVLGDVGLDMPTAFRVFLKKLVATKSIPFSISSEDAPAETISPQFERRVLAALDEARDKKRRNGPFHTAEELIAHLRRQKA